jgi:hypothetical protein
MIWSRVSGHGSQAKTLAVWLLTQNLELKTQNCSLEVFRGR